MFKSIINFFLWSSVNPDKVSLTIKGAVPFLTMVLAMYNVPVDVSSLVGLATEVFIQFTTIVTAGVTLYGLIRKFIVTFKG